MYTKSIWKYPVLLLCLISPLFSLAQEVTFEAYADARQVALNGYFDVSFVLINSNGSNLIAPSFKNFQVVSGPAVSASSTTINGVRSSKLSYIYTLKPKKIGNFTIGRASIRVGNRELRTQPFKVEVVESREESNEVFVRAEPSTEEAWIGQQIIVSYRLYYSGSNIDSYNVLKESEYPGFYSEDIRQFNSRMTQEKIDDKFYSVRLLRQVALYPQQTGTLTIDPMEIQLGLIAPGSGRRGNFLLNRTVKRVPVQTEPVNIRIRPLPADAPPSFTGAVGQYEITSKVNRRKLTTDDVLQLSLSISGDGDIKRVQPPAIAFPESFEVYDPKIIDETRYEIQGRIIGKKVIEYLVLPTQAGVHNIQPAFTYFDPDSTKYVTLNPSTYRVDVEQGSTRSRSSAPIQDPDQVIAQDIKYIKMNTRIGRTNQHFLGSAPFWIFTALPFLLLTGAVVYKQHLIRKADVDPLLLRTKRARKVALKRLQVAETHLKTKSSRAFYDEISKAMLGYVCDKLQIPRSELTKDNLKSKLQSLQVSEELTENFMQIIHNTEIALFAGKDHTAAMEETYQKTLDVLTNIEQAF